MRKDSKEIICDDQSLLPGFIGVIGRVAPEKQPSYTREFKKWMLEAQDSECGYCGLAMNLWDRPSIEHVVSRLKGGSDAPPNLLYACGRCNNQKKDRSHDILRTVLRLRGSELEGIVNAKQANDLMALGIDLRLRPEEPLHFESREWPHTPKIKKS